MFPIPAIPSCTTAVPNRLASVNRRVVPASSRITARRKRTSDRGSRSTMLPVIRRCITSHRPPSSLTIRYLPRRPTDSMRRPVTARSTSRGGTGRVRRSSKTSIDSIRRPTSSGSIWRRIVSTSGSSGTPPVLPGGGALLRRRPRVGAEVDLLDLVVREMRVELGGGNVGVPEHLLHRAEVAPAGQQVRGEGVPQRVRAHLAVEPRRARVALDDLVQPLAGQAP